MTEIPTAHKPAFQTQEPPPHNHKTQIAICVAGMHRSGTSLLSNLLHQSGVFMGDKTDLGDPAPDNARGFWEEKHFVEINDAILERFCGGWDDPPNYPSDWPFCPELSDLRERAQTQIERMTKNGLWGWKDPRNSITLPFWQSLIPDLRVVVCLRHPYDVARSLKARNYSSIAHGLRLWLIYYQALNATVLPQNRIITHYNRYFEQPGDELFRLFAHLGLEYNQAILDVALRNVDSNIRHHQVLGDEIMNLPVEVLTQYSLLCTEAQLDKESYLRLFYTHQDRQSNKWRGSWQGQSFQPQLWSEQLSQLIENNLKFSSQLVDKSESLNHVRSQLEAKTEAEAALLQRSMEHEKAIACLENQSQLTKDQLVTIRQQMEDLQNQANHQAACIADRDQSIGVLQAQLSLNNQEMNVIIGSRAWRLVSWYWNFMTHLRKRPRMAYEAFRSSLRRLIPYPLRHWVVVHILRPKEYRSITAGFGLVSSSVQPSARISSQNELQVEGKGCYDLICFPIIDWEFRFQRPQQLLTQFAAHGHRCYYLRTGFHSGDNRANLSPIAKRVFGVQLPGPVTLNLYRDQIREKEMHKFVEALDHLRQEVGIEEAVCLVQLPFWAPIAVAAREKWGWKIVYDCLDEHSGFSDTSNEMLGFERELVRHSDLVVTTSHSLLEKSQSLTQKVTLISNATDFDHFHNKPAMLPLQHLSHPIIGYYGAIADWFDVEMIETAAQAHPDWQFALIGSTYLANVTSLETLPNVHLLGERPYSELPGFLHEFDVACIPFKINSLTQATNPVKFYEYLSAGKPVVAVDLPELRQYAGYYYPVHSPESFISQIETALVEHSPLHTENLVNLAKRNTWAVRHFELHREIVSLYDRVNVIVATAGTYDLDQLRGCLDSLWRKNLYPNTRVTVVVHESDKTATCFLREASTQEPRLTVIRTEGHHSLSQSFSNGTQGLDACEYVVLLHPSVVFSYNWISRLVGFLSNPQIGIVCPNISKTNGDVSEILSNRTSQDEPEHSTQKDAHLQDRQFRDVEKLTWFCMGFRCKLLDSIGPLDQGYVVDEIAIQDLACRVRHAGYRVVCAEDTITQQLQHLTGSAVDGKWFSKEKARFESRWHRSLAESNQRNGELQSFAHDRIDWQCNICGERCRSPLTELGREIPACSGCQSTVRMRAVVHLLSIELFGESLVLADFPKRSDLEGIGLSDWEVYADSLAKKLSYRNTYYHKEPRLDISTDRLSQKLLETVDFVISTDVFEHVAPPVSVAFENVLRLLKPGGLFVFSVPYTAQGTTQEHFPELHRYTVLGHKEKRILHNTTRDGREQTFNSLVFHGGEGDTLEMRLFSETDLLNDMTKAGFESIQIFRNPFFRYGIYWKDSWSLPMTARKPKLPIGLSTKEKT